MPRLRRVARMCSRTVSGTAYRFRHGSTLCSPTVEKSSAVPLFAAVTCRQSAPDYPRERGDSQEGGNRRCLPSCAPARRQRTPPPRGAARSRRPQTANPLTEVQRKTLRPLGANPPTAVRVPRSAGAEKGCRPSGTNTLTQFAHPAQPVQRKRLPPVRGEPAYAVRVPHLITARKCKKPPYGSYGGFSMSYLVCWVIINTGMYQIS